MRCYGFLFSPLQCITNNRKKEEDVTKIARPGKKCNGFVGRHSILVWLLDEKDLVRRLPSHR